MLPSSQAMRGRPLSDVPVAVNVKRRQWACLGGSQGWLFAGDAPDWAALDDDPRAIPVKTNPLRKVYRVTWQEHVLYAKVYLAADCHERWKWRWRGVPAQLEFERLLTARQRGAPVPQAVAWSDGLGPHARTAILLTDSVGQGQDLADVLWGLQLPPTAHLRACLDAAAAAVARLHCAGIEHRDLHPGNIMLVPDNAGAALRPYVTDLQNCRVEQRGGHASADPTRSWRMANLAVLTAALTTRLNEDDCRCFLAAYIRRIQPHRPWTAAQTRTYADKVLRLARRHDERMARQYDRRCLRDSAYACRITTGPWRGHVYLAAKHPDPAYNASRHSFTLAQWQTALANLPMPPQDAETVKAGSRNRVSRGPLTVGNTVLEVVYKHALVKPGWRGLLQGLCVSRALRQWQSAHALLARRIRTAWPLVALERRSAGLIRESILITEAIPESTNVKLMHLRQENLIRNPAQRLALARQLGALLGTLRLRGFRHRDCKISNVLLRPWPPAPGGFEPYLVDLDGLSRDWRRWLASPHEALLRLAASASELPHVRMSDLLAGFKGYLTTLGHPAATDAGLRHRLWRRLRPTVAKRSAHTLRTNLVQDGLSDWPFRNILIIKPSSMGDVVRCLGILPGLRKKYPEARISWLIRPEFAELLAGVPEVDRIILFDRRRYGLAWRNPLALRDLWRFMGHLRSRRYDLVLDMQGLFRSGFFAWWAQAPLCLGPADARELAGLMYTHRIAVAPEGHHVVESYQAFAATLKCGWADSGAVLRHHEEAWPDLEKRLAAAGLEPGAAPIVLLPGGSAEAKRWPAERFAALADAMADEYNAPIIVCGAGAVDAELAVAICDLARAEPLNLVNETSPPQLAALLMRARLVVGNDSGPLHLAAALAAPTVGLYGPTNPAVVGPYEQMAYVVEAGGPVPRQGRYSKAAEHAMTEITVEDVLAMARRCWTETAPGRTAGAPDNSAPQS